MPAEIVFEDERIVAVHKPPGQAVIPGRGLPEDPLTVELTRRLSRRVWVVHRIDREASGLVLFALESEAHRALSLAFESRRAEKAYLVVASGRVEQSGESAAPLREFGSGRMGVDPRGKASFTSWKPLRAGPRASLLEVRPRTGRRHQIRAHLHHAGHPVLGDPLYGAPLPVGGCPRLMLHAWELRLRLPGFPEALRAEPDADFSRLAEEFTRP